MVGFFINISDPDSLLFLPETLRENHWLYNSFAIVNYTFYVTFFYLYIGSNRVKKLIRWVLIFYVISAIVNLIFSKVFFVNLSAYSTVFGSFLLLASILYYFYEVLQSDEILYFKRSLVFYVAFGSLIFHISVTPLFIYSQYFIEQDNPLFVKIHYITLTLTNIFMYTCYIIGFIICSRKNKSYS